ncbi:ABC transporter ATP-binding protein [Pelagibacterales bacterium SAG-MED01]|nr:ABC transporter ATP-binding protein [Pelagibacterales bacterium SAG-MED01]
MVPEKYKLLVAGSGLSKVYFLFLSSIVVLFLEMLGIGLVPMFALAIINTEASVVKVSEFLNFEINFEINRKKIILISGFIFLSVFMIKNLVITWVTYLQLEIMKIFKINGAKKLYNYYIKSDFTFFLKSNPSEMIRGFESDIAYAYRYFLAKITYIREIILVIIIFGSLIIIDPIIYSLSFFLLFIAATIFYFFYKKILKFRARILREKQAKKYKIVSQTFHSIKEVKVLNKENFFLNSFNKVNFSVEHLTFITGFVTALPKIVYEMLAVTSIISISVFLIFLDKPDDMIIPIISLLVAAGARFIPAFGVITQSMGTIRYMQPQFDSIVKAFREEKKLEKKLNDDQLDVKKISFKKNIEINDLSFGYNKKNVINDLSLVINKGETIGIIGSSGEGKSTLINLILGLLTPNKGTIASDGINISKNLKSWQKKIGYISQDIYLIDDTIKTNICFGLSDEEIKEDNLKLSIKKAQLEEFINDLPDKEMTTVGNVGSRISGGQKQRIGIARALYTNPDILVLDEATSSLDLNNEKKIIDEMNNLKGDKTIIIVSHRTNALANCDKIYILKNGKIESNITYKELLKKNNYNV